MLISIDTVNQKSYNAGSKAREDVTYFLKKKGISPFSINSGNSKFLLIRELTRLASLFQLKKRIHSIEYAIIQYPLNINVMDKILLKRILTKGHVKVFLLVHDLVSMQGFNPSESIEDEVKEFNEAEGVILHNEAMVKFLLEQGLKVKNSTINFFDYHAKKREGSSNGSLFCNHIIFAGNLAKSQFLLRLPMIDHMIWDIFGAGLSLNQLPSFVNFHGPIAAELLPSVLPKGWGLVWDGNRADTISGKGGVYLKINSPHKASLYLASGIPLIVWQESAIANFVTSNHLGVVVSSLEDIDNKISSLDKDQIAIIKKSVLKYSKLITDGNMLESALIDLGLKAF